MSNEKGTFIGPGAQADKNGVAIGHNVYAQSGQVVIRGGISLTGPDDMKIMCQKCDKWLIYNQLSKTWTHQVISDCKI